MTPRATLPLSKAAALRRLMAKPGPIVGEANVTQLGKTIAFVEGKLMAEDGAVLATATASARLIETAKAIR